SATRYSIDVARAQCLISNGRLMAAIARPPDRTNGGFQTKSVNAATNTKPNQTTRNLTEALRVDSIFGIGARRSSIGVGLVEVCAVVALTARKSLTRSKELEGRAYLLAVGGLAGPFCALCVAAGSPITGLRIIIFDRPSLPPGI